MELVMGYTSKKSRANNQYTSTTQVWNIPSHSLVTAATFLDNQRNLYLVYDGGVAQEKLTRRETKKRIIEPPKPPPVDPNELQALQDAKVKAEFEKYKKMVEKPKQPVVEVKKPVVEEKPAAA